MGHDAGSTAASSHVPDGGRADGGLETVEASPLTLDLDVDPGGWTVQGVSLSGLPDGTILMSGER